MRGASPGQGRLEDGPLSQEGRLEAGAGSILALETSCDDTCAAVLDAEGRVRSSVISSQGVHDRFGGVVPEIASRQHLELVNLVVAQALEQAEVGLDEIELVGATQGPGLVGALLVGFATAKALAAARELPFAAVDHLQGHVAANFIAGSIDLSGATTEVQERQRRAGARASGGPRRPAVEPSPFEPGPFEPGPFEPPFVCLIASGGHTLLAHVRGHDGFEVLGRTLDDAAGEAFDKGARMLGLGYPGGAALERLARNGDPTSFPFPAGGPRPGLGKDRQAFAHSLDFSFAGLKTSLLYRLRELTQAEASARAADLAASYQAAIVERLLERSRRALEQTGLDRLAVGGGVAANGELRRRVGELEADVHVPERALCTDNAAMIASAARFAERLPYPSYLALDAYSTGERPPPTRRPA
ncbi:MAG TPA: tRNA (adenosine(37)-N6)-threonylcarbamoyltransferase complex transferase subunit TsaD [Solirubrobacteraceae bacterium]|nr:tRNA (adenosine(37)-N6)-threonylcarbamoyltransferase complex transferase subunit TsaD [Solirubrobacteraceae bacterium]